MARPATKTVLLVVALLLATAVTAPRAGAAAFLPPKGKVFHGVGGGYTIDQFARQTRREPAVFQLFTAWGHAGWAFDRADAQDGRFMLHVSTSSAPGSGEIITPAKIAAGRGDGFLVELNRRIAERGKPVYLRLMAEMNAHWNTYSAFDANGRARPGHSTRSFRQAWRRAAIIVRGGRGIDARLRRLRMRPLGRVLPRAPVAMQWVPQVAGAPDTRANSPRAYWPGGRYVDWVGTDFYSRFPNWSGLERFFAAFPRKPFVFAEYAVWGRDDPAFLRRLFSWSRARPRVRMLVYNQGVRADGPFRLAQYPRSMRTLKRLLRSPRYPTP